MWRSFTFFRGEGEGVRGEGGEGRGRERREKETKIPKYQFWDEPELIFSILLPAILKRILIPIPIISVQSRDYRCTADRHIRVTL